MKRSVHFNLAKISLVVLGAILTFTTMAQTTYTTVANGNWSSASTWSGGVVPSLTIAAGKTVNIKNAVTFDQNTDLVINGTLNIINDTLRYSSNAKKDIKINAGGALNITNGGLIQTITANQNTVTINGGRLNMLNSKISVSKDFTSSNGGKRSFQNSFVYIAGKYELNGGGTSPIDTIKGSLVEVALENTGDFHIGNGKLYIADALVRVNQNGNFKNDAAGSITVLPGATNNFGFIQLKVANDLKNDGAWVARIDAACIGGNITGSQMAAIDFTRAQDCGLTNVGDAPELVFKNPVLKSGQAKKQGAVYRFANVVTGVDAEIKLKKFSRNDIVMQDVDLPNLGWDKAFQPQFGLNGLVQPHQNWYIDFELKFYQAGTNTPVTLPKVDMTALDVDGDGLSVSEYAVFQNPSNVMYSTISYLVDQPAGTPSQSFYCPIDGLLSLLTPCLVCGGDGKSGLWNLTECTACNGTGYKYLLCNHAFDETNGDQLQGPVENFTNIDTAATQVMATYQYTDVNKIDFRYGAKSGSVASNGAGVRLNSVWFRDFSLAPPTILPVKLTNFSAVLNKKDVNLSWTAEQENVSHYVIQRSTDGKNYSDIAIVFASNTSNANYTYKDANVASSTNIAFYRLLMVDNAKEGGNYSETKVIRLGKETENIQLVTYPNPVTDKVQVTLPASWQGKTVMLQLYNANGVMMQSMQVNNASQTETMQMGKAVKGFYVVKAICNSEVAQQRIIKN